jgi:molybdenum cofactor cytidylyltransferase
MSDGTQCAAIVLAAGASTRLGQPKQLLQLDGESLLHRTVRTAGEAGFDPIFVVLGYEAERMRQEITDLRAMPVINPDWESGMASSLRCGVEGLMKKKPRPGRVLVLLCDQAKLSAEILSRLIQTSARTNSMITASNYAGRLGVPAIFHESLYPDLLEVKGDQGARAVILQHVGQTSTVEFSEGAVDIDTPNDLAVLRTISEE